jgi:hypothetical protein
MSERYHHTIAGQRNRIGSSRRERGAEEGAAWEDGGEETKRAGRQKSVEAAKGLRAPIIGEGNGRQTGASTTMTTIR